nr:glycosyltransferase [Psychromicrobium silvestre]
MLSLHTSPLEQPGSGDAGGMNVYIRQLATGLATAGVEVEIMTAGTSGEVEMAPGVLVRHLDLAELGLPGGRITKERLPRLLPALLDSILSRGSGGTDLLHSHYWISGLAALELSDAWSLPLVHSMHTMAKVKDRHRRGGQLREPSERAQGEERIVQAAHRLTANTGAEAKELEGLYGARPERIDVIPPGVDLEVFHPASRPAARAELGIDSEVHLVFAGRLQRLKGPHLLIEAVALLRRERPELRLRVSIIGSRSGAEDYDLVELVHRRGVQDLVQLLPPVPPTELALWFRSADIVAMPSSSESFGLVALEAEASGTPVVATRVGGLPEAVRDGETGILVDGLSIEAWAEALVRLADNPTLRASMGRSAASHAAGYSWQHTVQLTLETYQRALADAARA